MKTQKRKIAGHDGSKWPYYDSYAPDLQMDHKDKRIVRKGLKQQYYPNMAGGFNFKELKGRQKGIKNIEKQFINRLSLNKISSPRSNLMN